MNKLYIVNGDSTLHMLRDAGENCDIVVWRDVLHDGQIVPLTHPNYAQIRAKHLAKSLCLLEPSNDLAAKTAEILSSFTQRHEALATLDNYDEVLLWFEHDLYDQLQLMEVLSHNNILQHPHVDIISINSHPEVPFFHGFGNLTPSQLLALKAKKQLLTSSAKAQGYEIWHSILAANPQHITKVEFDSSLFPFWQQARDRYCSEFPNYSAGLTLTQKLLLTAIAQPVTDLPYLAYCLGLSSSNNDQKAIDRYQKALTSPPSFKRIFWQMQDLESAPFMGDSWLLKELTSLCQLPNPVLTTTKVDSEIVYQLTAIGQSLLTQSAHWLDFNDYDLWRGGVHITSNNAWQWHRQRQAFELY